MAWASIKDFAIQVGGALLALALLVLIAHAIAGRTPAPAATLPGAPAAAERTSGPISWSTAFFLAITLLLGVVVAIAWVSGARNTSIGYGVGVSVAVGIKAIIALFRPPASNSVHDGSPGQGRPRS